MSEKDKNDEKTITMADFPLYMKGKIDHTGVHIRGWRKGQPRK